MEFTFRACVGARLGLLDLVFGAHVGLLELVFATALWNAGLVLVSDLTFELVLDPLLEFVSLKQIVETLFDALVRSLELIWSIRLSSYLYQLLSITSLQLIFVKRGTGIAPEHS